MLGDRPFSALNCDCITREGVVTPDFCLWRRSCYVKCAVRVDCPDGPEGIGPCARESSWTGGHGRTGTQKHDQSGCDNNSKRRLWFHGGRSCRAAAEGVKLRLQAKRFVAKDLIFDVERPCGTGAACNSSNAKTKLVEPELEMVRAPWLFQHSGVVRRFCRVNRPDRIQRHEIERRLQRCFGTGQNTPRRCRGPRFACHRRPSFVRKHKR